MFSKTFIASILAVAGLASAQTTSITPAQSSALLSAYQSYFNSVLTDASFTSALGGLATNTAVLASLSGVLAAATGGGAVPTDLAALSSINSVIDTLPSAQAQAIHSLIQGEVSIAQSVLSTTAVVINPTTTALASSGSMTTAASGSMMTVTSGTMTYTTSVAPSTVSKAGAAPMATGVKVAGLGAAAFGAVVALL